MRSLGKPYSNWFGSPLKDTFYSPDQASRFYVANDESALEIVKTFYHELSHVYLGDFGRNVPKGSHPNVDKDIRAIEKEAERNFGGAARKQQ